MKSLSSIAILPPEYFLVNWLEKHKRCFRDTFKLEIQTQFSILITILQFYALFFGQK